MPLMEPFDPELAKGFLFGVLSGDTFDKYALGNVQASRETSATFSSSAF